jgi:hypothetical protein
MPTTVYDYLNLELGPSRTAWEALRTRIETRVAPALPAGGEVLGLFFPQLGFAANEAVLLVRWPDEARAGQGVVEIEGVQVRARDRLTATVRPAAGDVPRPGGVYVHRWFSVAPADVERFIDLSTQAWPSFEAGFAAHIFGLFRAADAAPHGEVRLLLLTRYADHGVWEASRRLPQGAREAVGARRELTASTIARSSLLLALR